MSVSGVPTQVKKWGGRAWLRRVKNLETDGAPYGSRIVGASTSYDGVLNSDALLRPLAETAVKAHAHWSSATGLR
jgi:hypothetical protein